MKIISDRQAVLARLDEARVRRVPILSPNAETPDEMEAILLAAQQFAVRTNCNRITVGIGITAGYPDHPQLLRLHPLARLHGTRTNAEMSSVCRLLPVALRWLDWLDSYTRDPWFNRVEAIPFLDHGWAPIEARLLANATLVKRMGIIFFDASALPFEENVVLTAAYVTQCGSHVVIEGCPDKIASQAEVQAATNVVSHSSLSKPARVREYVRRTGVDLVVPSLGTEHRGLPGESIRYRSALARSLQADNGAILVLHGTSSLGSRVAAVGRDGIVKVNFYTAAARAAGAALRSAWSTQPSPLPIQVAAGSFVHATRREAIRAEVFALLKCLGTPLKTRQK